MSKLASLNTIPNSYLVLKLLGIWGEVRSVEGEERQFEKAKHVGGIFFFFKLKERVSAGGSVSVSHGCRTLL